MQPWSYSHLDKFETCPKQFYHVKVAKDIVEPPTMHTDWGHTVHSAVEARVRDGTPLPDGMTQWESIVGQIAALPGEMHAEVKLAVDSAFQPADWDTAWSRGIIDLMILTETQAAVIDWKTGKYKPSEQIALYVAYVFAHFPQVMEVSGMYVWLKERKLSISKYKRSDVAAIWQDMLPRIARLEGAYEQDKWPPKPSGLCNGWCPVRSCQYWREKR